MLMDLITRIGTAPKFLFDPLKKEVANIDWDAYAAKNRRGSFSNFYSSRSVSMRTHVWPPGRPLNILEISEVVECEDTAARWDFPFANLMVRWVYNKVKGEKLGRIQLVNVAPHSQVALHIDPGEYFRVHKRYHVPIVTNPKVTFMNDQYEAHMEEGGLYRLWNIGLHGVKNDSDFERIHLIVDVKVGENQWSV